MGLRGGFHWRCVTVVAAALLGGSCGQVEKTAAAAPDSPRFTMARAASRVLSRRIRAVGAVQPVEAVSITTPRLTDSDGNLILTRIVPNGTSVKAGDIVAEFDRTRQLDRARDALARYDDLQHQYEQRIAQQSSDAEKRASDIQQAEADLAKAQLELRKGPLLSEIDRLKYESQLDNAKVHLASLKKSSQFRTLAAAADLKVLELQRDRQKMAMERAQMNADRLQIRAPIAGMVAQEVIWRRDGPGHPQEGDQLWTGQPLVRIFASGQMEVLVSVAEPDGVALTADAGAEVRLDAYRDRVFHAHFSSASPVASPIPESTVRMFSARYRLDETDPRLLPDLTAAVDIEWSTKTPVLAVPRAAIHRRNNQTYVIRAESGRQERAVSLGASDASFIEITAGLREGDPVLIPNP